MNSYICTYNSNYPYQYNMSSLHWCFHCSYSMPICPSSMLDAQFNTLSESMTALQESMKELRASNKRMLSYISHVRSLLPEEMQLDSTFTDTPEISDTTTITSVIASTYDDGDKEVVDIVKSQLDSQLSVLAVGYTAVPKDISPFVLFIASIDTTELEFSPSSFSSKGPILPVKGYGHKRDMKFDCKVFDIMPSTDIFMEFHGPSTTIDSLPLSFGLHDCKWMDTSQVSGSFDIQQYHHIKLLCQKLLAIRCYLSNWVDIGQELLDVSGCALLFIDHLSSSSNAHNLFDKIIERSRCVAMLYGCEYIGEVEMLCSDNLTSFCSYYNLLGKSLENSLLDSLDGASTSIVDTYIIDQLGSIEVNCKRSIDVLYQISHSALVARQMVGALGSVNLNHHDENMPLSIVSILWHYNPLANVTFTSAQSFKRKVRMDNPQTMVDYHDSNVVHLRILIEDVPLLIPMIREAILLISNLHMSLYAGWIVEEYTHVVLGGVDTVTNCFIYLWNPTWNSIVVFLCYVCILSDKMECATILPLLSELPSFEQVEPGLPLRLPFEFECKIGNFSTQLNLEVVTSHPARILEWTGCVDYLEGWTLLSPQLQEAEGILTLADQLEGLSISFVGTPGSSHLVPAVHDFFHKEPYVAADIKQHTLETLTNCPLQFRNSSRYVLAAMYSTIHQRAILVYCEVQHIQGFHNSISSQLSEELMLTKLDVFLNESHSYASILYACYCTESEELIWLFHDKGFWQMVLLQCMDDMLWVVQKNNISALKYPLYIKGVYGFMLDTILGVIDAVGITSHGLEKEGTDMELGHGTLSFLQILPSTAPKVDIIDIGSMYVILVDDVKLLSKSLCFDIIIWLLCLGRLIWPCLKIGCMAMHRQALVTFTGLTKCSYSERALQFAVALTLVSITEGDVFYMEANSGAVTRVYWNGTCATKFVLNAKYSLISETMPLSLNLEDKVLFEGRRIVMNITKLEDPCEKMSNYIWDPVKMSIYLRGK